MGVEVMKSLLTMLVLGTLTLACPARAIEIHAEVEATDAETVPVPVFHGEWPETTRAVSIDLEDHTVREAVEEIAERAGWGLVFSAPEDVADRDLSLTVSKAPAAQALAAVLAGTGLRAELKNNILVITSQGGEADVARVKVPLGDLDVSIEPGRRKIGKKDGPETRTTMGSDLVLDPGEHVDGDAMVVGGSLVVSEGAYVDGDAVAVGGSVTIQPGAHVDGDAVAVGGEVTVEEGGNVDGDRVSVGGSVGGLIATVVGMGIQEDRPRFPRFLLSFLASVVRTAALFVLGLLLIAFASERVDNTRAYLTEQPGYSVLAGLAILIGFIPLCILLAVTVIGIPLIPIAILLLAMLTVVGLTAFCTWIGERIPVFEGRKTPVGALAIGLALLFVVDLVPVVGSTAILVVSFISAGAALLSRFGKRKPEPEVPRDVADAI
jgi:hypothetical protein